MSCSWRASVETARCNPPCQERREQRKSPGGFPPGLVQVVRPNLPVALSAEDHGDRVLILQLVDRGRLGGNRDRRRGHRTGVLLVEVGPGTSAENVRFLTGVQRVTIPSWPIAKSGLQHVTPASATEHADPAASAAKGGLGQACRTGPERRHRRARSSSRDPSYGCKRRGSPRS